MTFTFKLPAGEGQLPSFFTRESLEEYLKKKLGRISGGRSNVRFELDGDSYVVSFPAKNLLSVAREVLTIRESCELPSLPVECEE